MALCVWRWMVCACMHVCFECFSSLEAPPAALRESRRTHRKRNGPRTHAIYVDAGGS